MRASLAKSPRLGQAAMLGVGLAIAMMVASTPHQSPAQFPNPTPMPIIVPALGTTCQFANAAGCDDCAAAFPPLVGCTAPPPKDWTNGACGGVGGGCSDWTNYNCGVQINCGGFPNGLACVAAFNLCM